MSGLSLAVGRPTDGSGISSVSKQNQKQGDAAVAAGAGGSIIGYLRVIELQLVAFVLVFSGSGLVPLLDLTFPALVSAYLLALARLAFPTQRRSSSSPGSSEIFRGGRLFRAYVVVGAAVGLFLPLAYVLGGFARGDKHAVRSATPHLFLLSFQILTENLIGGLSLFSPPVRAMVPVLYTVRRIFVLLDWIYVAWFHQKVPANAETKEEAWFWFGKILSVANLVYSSINLFGFLIPSLLPQAFEKYFKERDEMAAKRAENRRSTFADQPGNQSTKRSD